jgi:hypothetical protein
MTQAQLHVAANVGISVISELERVTIRKRAPGTLGRLSKAIDLPENCLDDILNRRHPQEPAPLEQPAADLTPTEKAFRAFGEKLDTLNGKLDALLKHYDIMWQPGEPPAADE